jgi:hypothetical protein
MRRPARILLPRIAYSLPSTLACVATLSLICAFAVAEEPATSRASNAAPKIWGHPAGTARRGTLYVFKPSAADADGDRLTFSIVNKPRWMWFSTRTGKLSGWPKWAQRNRTFSGIVIRVSDGRRTVSLPPFSIRVGTPASGGTGNRSPQISGTPVTQARVGRPYAFKPTATDPDGDRLSFAIVNKPGWAVFDASSGTLSGTPQPANVGRFDGVTIRVSDGKATAGLDPFSIVVSPADAANRSVTLTWSKPTRNTDGSALTDLAAYLVSYGQMSRDYGQVVRVPAGSTQSVVIEGLAAGRWFFAIRSVNSAGVASDYSGEVTAVL